MLNHRTDRTDHQKRTDQDEPKIPSTYDGTHGERRQFSRISFSPRALNDVVWHESLFRRARSRDPDSYGVENKENCDSNGLYRRAPSQRPNEIVHRKRRYHSAQSQPEIGIAHGAASPVTEPTGNQHLIGNRAGKHIAQHFGDAQ